MALILLLGVNYCAGWTADTANYLSAARSLVAGDGLVMWNGVPYPAVPLFPFLLASAELLGIDAAGAARYLNAAAFGLTVFTTAAWLRRRVRSSLLAVWAGGACLLMPALATAAASVWTEIIFILFTMISLSSLDRFLSGKAKSLLPAAVAAGAACLTRDVGAILIGAGALILMLRNDAGTRVRLRDAALWSVVSLAPYGVWMVRNLLVKGSALHVWTPIDFSGLVSLHLATGELALWLFGPTGFELLNGAFGRVTGIDLAGPATVAAIAAKSVLLAAPVLGAGYALARYRPGFLRANRTALTLTISFAAAHLLFLLVFRPLTGHTMQVRYLLPLFPPLLVAATLALDGCLAKRSFTNARVGGIVVAAAVTLLWTAQHAGATVGNIGWWMGRCWTSPESPESDVLRYLRANPLDGEVWSSEPWALYLHTEQRRLGTINASLADNLANKESVQSESVYVVLFDWSFRIRDYGYGVDDVGALPGVELVADLDDGVIYHRPAVIPAPAVEDRSAAEDRVVRAYFDVHVYEDALAYVREPCTGADVQAGFFLRVVPAAAADLSAASRAQGADFNSLDFSFAERGVIADGRCLAVVTFDYPIARFQTGQSRPGTPPFWDVETAMRDPAPAP